MTTPMTVKMLFWIIPSIVTKKVDLIPCLFTTSSDNGQGGWAAGGIKTKANSAQLSWNWG
jgi:hypothetical protein